MPVSSVQGRYGNDQEPMRARSKESSSSVNNTDDRNKSNNHDEVTKKTGESDNDHRRKKRTSGGRKSRRGSNASTMTRSSSRRMLLVDDDDDDGGVLSKNRELSAFNITNRSLSWNSINSSRHREPSPLSKSNRSLSLNSCSSTNSSSMQSRSQASSNRSFNSNFYRNGGDSDGKDESYSIDDFISDIEDDGEGNNDSAVEIPVVINNGERNLQSSVVSTTSSTHRRRSTRTHSRDQSRRESRKKNRDDPNASRNKIRRHRSSSQNGDLGISGRSSRYILEGVYSNERSSQSEIKKTENSESEEEDDELAKLTTDSKEKDTKNRRRLHRQSSSKDQFATTKSKFKEQQPRSRRGIGRTKSASSRVLFGTPSEGIGKRRSRSNDRRVKRGSGMNTLSAESQEGMKKLFGATSQSSKEETIVASDTNQKSLTEIKTSTLDNRPPSIKSIKDSLNDSEKKNGKVESPSQNSGRAERRRRRIMELTKARSSIDNSTRKDRNTKRTSSRSEHKSSRRLTRDKESYRKDHRATKGNLWNDSIKKKDVDSKMDTNNMKSTNFSSVEECLSGSEKDDDRSATDKSSSDKTNKPISLTDLFSNNEQYAKKGSIILPPSLANEDEYQKKKKTIKKNITEDDDENINDERLQLSFIADKDRVADDLFALTLMSEQLNTYELFESVEMKATKEIEPQQIVIPNLETKVRTSSRLPSYENDKNSFTDRYAESTKGSSSRFSVINDLGPFDDDVFADDNKEKPTKKKKRNGMLTKMRKGLTESGRTTVQRAASTRNLFEQATIKVFARGKEEGRGLLSSTSDYTSD